MIIHDPFLDLTLAASAHVISFTVDHFYMPPTGAPTATFAFSTNEIVNLSPYAIDEGSLTDTL